MLLQCPECGNAISQHSAQCPKCGCPNYALIERKKELTVASKRANELLV